MTPEPEHSYKWMHRNRIYVINYWLKIKNREEY